MLVKMALDIFGHVAFINLTVNSYELAFFLSVSIPREWSKCQLLRTGLLSLWEHFTCLGWQSPEARGWLFWRSQEADECQTGPQEVGAAYLFPHERKVCVSVNCFMCGQS